MEVLKKEKSGGRLQCQQGGHTTGYRLYRAWRHSKSQSFIAENSGESSIYLHCGNNLQPCERTTVQLGWKGHPICSSSKKQSFHAPLSAGFSSAAPRLHGRALPGVVRLVHTRPVTPADIMIAFALSTGTASLPRRSPLLPSAAAVSAFRPAIPVGWPAAATRVRLAAQGVVVTHSMADGIKAPGSSSADDAVWRQKLSREQYRILRQKGTEMGGTGEYNKFTPAEGFFKVRLPGWGDMGRGGPGGMMTAARCLSNTSGRERQRECRRRPATSTGERRASSALPRS